MQIGVWVRRDGGKWHLVESVVAGDAVTRCGRRMDRVTRSGGELRWSEMMPLTRMIGQPQLCKAGCEARAGFEDGVFVGERVAVTGGVMVSEDDASTQPELVP